MKMDMTVPSSVIGDMPVAMVMNMNMEQKVSKTFPDGSADIIGSVSDQVTTVNDMDQPSQSVAPVTTHYDALGNVKIVSESNMLERSFNAPFDNWARLSVMDSSVAETPLPKGEGQG